MKRKTRMALAGGVGLTAVIVFLLTPVLLLALAGCDTAGSRRTGILRTALTSAAASGSARSP